MQQQQQQPSPQQQPPFVGEDPTNLIVNYVPTPVTDAELRQLFEQYGELESARVIVDRHTHHPKGYGFVKFKHEASAREAIEKMNGFEILNKRLKVTPAKGPQNAQINKVTQRMQAIQQQQAPPAATAQPAQSLPAPQMYHHHHHHPQAAVMAPQVQPTYVFVDANGVPIQTFAPQGATFAPGAQTYIPAGTPMQQMPYVAPPQQMPPPPQQQQQRRNQQPSANAQQETAAAPAQQRMLLQQQQVAGWGLACLLLLLMWCATCASCQASLASSTLRRLQSWECRVDRC